MMDSGDDTEGSSKIDLCERSVLRQRPERQGVGWRALPEPGVGVLKHLVSELEYYGSRLKIEEEASYSAIGSSRRRYCRPAIVDAVG